MGMRYIVTSAGIPGIAAITCQQKFASEVGRPLRPVAEVPFLIWLTGVPIDGIARLKSTRKRHYDATYYPPDFVITAVTLPSLNVVGIVIASLFLLYCIQ